MKENLEKFMEIDLEESKKIVGTGLNGCSCTCDCGDIQTGNATDWDSQDAVDAA